MVTQAIYGISFFFLRTSFLRFGYLYVRNEQHP